MKIVELIPSLLTRAGAEVFCFNLSKSLAKDNDVTLLTLYNELDKSFKMDGVNYISTDKGNEKILKNSKHLKEILLEIKPDVVHMHLNCIMSYYLAFGFKNQNFKLFLTVHSLYKKDFTLIERFLIRILTKKGILKLIGISDSISKDIKNNGLGVDSTIYNGTILYSPKKNTYKDVIKIVNVASFRPEKNQIFLLDAYKEIQKTTTNIELIFVGDGPLFNDVKQKAISEGIKNVKFVGKSNNVDYYLASSDIFCLSSIYEGNPISIIEAMSVGLTLVVPNIGGIPDVVQNYENGILYEPCSINSLVSALNSAINNKDFRMNCFYKNTIKAKEYSIEECAQNYLKTFNKVQK